MHKEKEFVPKNNKITRRKKGKKFANWPIKKAFENVTFILYTVNSFRVRARKEKIEQNISKIKILGRVLARHCLLSEFHRGLLHSPQK